MHHWGGGSYCRGYSRSYSRCPGSAVANVGIIVTTRQSLILLTPFYATMSDKMGWSILVGRILLYHTHIQGGGVIGEVNRGVGLSPFSWCARCGRFPPLGLLDSTSDRC